MSQDLNFHNVPSKLLYVAVMSFVVTVTNYQRLLIIQSAGVKIVMPLALRVLACVSSLELKRLKSLQQ